MPLALGFWFRLRIVKVCAFGSPIMSVATMLGAAAESHVPLIYAVNYRSGLTARSETCG